MQVRVQTLQELVYKQGSAGITKAAVSVVFHNDKPQNSPSGYEDKEYITVTRQVWGCMQLQARRLLLEPATSCSRAYPKSSANDGSVLTDCDRRT